MHRWHCVAGPGAVKRNLSYFVIAIAYGCVVFVCVTDRGSNHPLCRVARWRTLRSFGRYSYAMYVIHIFAKRWFDVAIALVIYPRFMRVPFLAAMPPIVFALFISVVTLGASYLLAVVSWHVFEKHFLRLKKYFPYQIGASDLPESRIVAEPRVPECVASAVTS